MKVRREGVGKGWRRDGRRGRRGRGMVLVRGGGEVRCGFRTG